MWLFIYLTGRPNRLSVTLDRGFLQVAYSLRKVSGGNEFVESVIIRGSSIFFNHIQ